ncbi:MAG: amidohydrolase [Bacteroidales bacterium]|nr:amidohydrolase [Bacteroidales bacterium]
MKKLFPIFLLIILSCSEKMKHADLIVYNAKIYTVDDNFRVVDAFAVKNGKFVLIGNKDKILGEYKSDNILDLDGLPVYPGFIDAHCHFYSYGLGLIQRVDLTGTKSVEEIINILKKHLENNPSAWLEGRGWDQNDWENKNFPDKTILDKYFPDIPVYLTRIDGHAAWVNSEILKRANIGSGEKIEGGEILLVDGDPSGILIDNAMTLIQDIIPDPDIKTRSLALQKGENKCISVGLTTIFDAGLELSEVHLIDSLYENSQLDIRINAMLTPTPENLGNYIIKGPYKNKKLTVNSIKLYADGALGSRGAKLLEPYSDDLTNSGIIVTSPDSIREICTIALKNGYSVNTHAIGDSANRLILNLYGEFLKSTNDKRWRIEHAQVIHPEDFVIFSKFSIIPSVQPTHATSDMYWAEDRLGRSRVKGAYAYKTLLGQNGWIPLGTDFPVEDINPLFTFYAAVARKDIYGNPENGFQKENSLSREETLKGMTIWAAKSGFMENEVGSIETGKFADFVVLEEDIMEAELKNIPNIKVKMTFLEGGKVFNR